MSDDELLVLIVSLFGVLYGWGVWYKCILSVWPFERGKTSRLWLGVLPVFCMIAIYSVLKTLASFDVVGDFNYVIFYVVFGLAWLFVGRELLYILFDLSWRDDVLERNNTAALLAISGGLFGLTASYAGANIGDGPGWWCVLGAGGLAFIAWFMLLEVYQLICKVFERITIERNVATGLRTGFYMLASGLILGRGAAGDWTSFEQTVIEFFDAWPVLLLTLLAIVVERWYIHQESSEPARDRIFGSIMWGLVYVSIAVVAIMLSPELPQNQLYGLAKLTLWGSM